MNLTFAEKSPLSVLPGFLSPLPSRPQELEPGWVHVSSRDEALRFLFRAADRCPREHSVGITIACADTRDAELTCWFESWAQLWSALRHMALHLSGRRGEELSALTRRLSQMRLTYGGDDAQVARLQRLFGPAVRVLWMGTFQNLRAGEGAYARALVLSYLGFELPEGAEPEVPSCDLDLFIAWLRRRAFN